MVDTVAKTYAFIIVIEYYYYQHPRRCTALFPPHDSWHRYIPDFITR